MPYRDSRTDEILFTDVGLLPDEKIPEAIYAVDKLVYDVRNGGGKENVGIIGYKPSIKPRRQRDAGVRGHRGRKAHGKKPFQLF